MMRSRVLLALLASAAIAASPSVGVGEHEHEPVPPSPAPLSQAAGAGPLQAMIDSAHPGDMLHIPAGTYEGPIVIDRSIILHPMGEVIVDGGGSGTVVTITAPDTVVHGLEVRHSGPGPVGQPAGFSIQADDVTVEGSVVRSSYIGIAVRGVDGAVIDGNRIEGDRQLAIDDAGHATGTDEHEGHVLGGAQATTRGDGISLWNATDATVKDNHIEGVRDGIYATYGSGIRVEGNTVTQSRYALHDMYAMDLTISGNTLRDSLSGLILMYGGPVVVERNLIVGNRSASTGFGILIKDADRVVADGNTVADNRIGLHIENGGARDPDAAELRHTTIALNGIGVELAPASRAAFSDNTIVDNTIPVMFAGDAQIPGVVWTVDGRGNYWDGYQGYDADGDGVGDLAFRHPGTVERIVNRQGELAALAGSPGFALLGRLESRWSPSRPAVVDDAPLMRPLEPTVTATQRPGRAPTVALGSFVIVVACVLALIWARRPTGVLA